MRWLAYVAVALGIAASAQDQPRQTLPPQDDWPARLTTGLSGLAEHALRVLKRDPAHSRNDTNRDSDEADTFRVLRAEPHGLGIVLERGRTERDDESDSADSVVELVFVSYSVVDVASTRPARETTKLPGAITFKDVERGVRWELHEPKSTQPRGLIVHLGGNKYVRRALLADGWAVLTSSGTGRYFDRRKTPQVFEITSEVDVAETAVRIAAMVDDELSDWPYSLEAVLSYLAERKPELPQQPAVLMGFSIGAIGLPAVAKRMPERFAATVIVAGGADLLMISQTSQKANPGIDLRWSPPARAADLFAGLDEAYLANSKLDPHNAAAALRDTPILMLHASFDQVVPAKTGDALWRRLGEPERRVFPVGHGHLLRVMMRMQAGQIAQWTASATTPQENP